MTILETFNISPTTEHTEKELNQIITKYDRYQSTKSKAILKAEEEFYLKNERMRIQLEMNTNIPTSEYENRKQLDLLMAEKKANADPKYAVFITINPQNNSLDDFPKLDQCVQKAISKCWITDYAYVYEQRSDNKNEIHGLHTHILLRRNTRPSNLEREIRSTFKGIVGKPDKHINIKYIKKEWINDKLNYMAGNKTGNDSTGKPKSEKVPIDIFMREKLQIPRLFKNDECAFETEKLFS